MIDPARFFCYKQKYQRSVLPPPKKMKPVRLTGVAYICFANDDSKFNINNSSRKILALLPSETTYSSGYMSLTVKQAKALDLRGLPVLIEHKGQPVGRVLKSWCDGKNLFVNIEVTDESQIDAVRSGNYPSLSVNYSIIEKSKFVESQFPMGHYSENTTDSMLVFKEISLTADPFFKGTDLTVIANNGSARNHFDVDLYSDLRVISEPPPYAIEKNTHMSDLDSHPEQQEAEGSVTDTTNETKASEKQTSRGGDATASKIPTNESMSSLLKELGEDGVEALIKNLVEQNEKYVEQAKTSKIQEFDKSVGSLKEAGLDEATIECARQAYVSGDASNALLVASIMKLGESFKKNTHETPSEPATGEQSKTHQPEEMSSKIGLIESLLSPSVKPQANQPSRTQQDNKRSYDRSEMQSELSQQTKRTKPSNEPSATKTPDISRYLERAKSIVGLSGRSHTQNVLPRDKPAAMPPVVEPHNHTSERTVVDTKLPPAEGDDSVHGTIRVMANSLGAATDNHSQMYGENASTRSLHIYSVLMGSLPQQDDSSVSKFLETMQARRNR